MRNDTGRRVIMWRDDIFVVKIFNFPATVLLIFLYGSLPRIEKYFLKNCYWFFFYCDPCTGHSQWSGRDKAAAIGFIFFFWLGFHLKVWRHRVCQWIAVWSLFFLLTDGTAAEDLPELSRLLLDPMRSQNLRLPNVFSFLPYLLNDPLSTIPAFVSGQNRMDGNLTDNAMPSMKYI